MVLLLTGAMYAPLQANAASPVPSDKFYYPIKGGFTQDQFDQWIDKLVNSVPPVLTPAQASQILPWGERIIVRFERTLEVTLDTETNDAERLNLVAFDTKAKNTPILASTDSRNTVFAAGPPVLVTLDSVTRVVEEGGIEFTPKTGGRPGLMDSYSAMVMYQGTEDILGYSGLLFSITDLGTITTVVEYFTGAVAAGGGVTVTIPGEATPTTTIPANTTPLAPPVDSKAGDGSGSVTIPSERPPLAATPELFFSSPLFWILIIAAIAIVVILLIVFARKRKLGSQDQV